MRRRRRARRCRRADRRMISKSCVLSRSGRVVQTHAAAAATIGDEKLVPTRRRSRSGSVEQRLGDGDAQLPAPRGRRTGDERRERRDPAALVRRPDGEDVRVRGRVRPSGSPRSPLVAGGGDDERARAERDRIAVLEQRIVVLAAEAEVDDAGPAAGGLDDALDRGALVEEAERARVPDAEHRLRIDADDPDAVVRRGRRPS